MMRTINGKKDLKEKIINELKHYSLELEKEVKEKELEINQLREEITKLELKINSLEQNKYQKIKKEGIFAKILKAIGIKK